MAHDQTLLLKRSQALPFVEMRRADRSSACYHTHSHDEFSFGVIDAGEADYRNQGRINHIGAGMTVTINPADAHSCNPNEGLWSYRMLFIDARWVGQLQQEMLNDHSADYLPFPNQYARDLKSYQSFSELFDMLITATDPLMAESLLVQYLERCFVNSDSRKKRLETPDLSRIKRIKELIMDRLDANISLNEFSDCSGLSRYHLIRSFKHAYGQSPHAFQLDQRIKKAKSLLQNGESIVNAASMLGFADQSHFQRNFKKRLAVTPRQYQAFFT